MKASNILSKVIILIVLLIVSSSTMVISAESYFNADSEGWGSTGDVHGFTWVSNVGNPPGSIYSIDDTSGDTWYFVAPAKFLGNQSGSYGHALSYDLKISARDANPWTDMPDIAIIGNGVTLALYGAFVPTAGFWSSFRVVLDENAGWVINNISATQAQIKNVLANVTSLTIRAEFKNGADNAYLDNVEMNSVPEPASMSAIVIGFFGTAMCAIRRKR